jgi:cytochrome c oxidase subunit 2
VVATGKRAVARRVVGLAVGGVLTGALLSGCSVDQAFSFGWPQGGVTPQSHKMFNLWIGSTVAALAVGVFVWGLIFWCIVRYRKRGDALPAQTRYNLPVEMVYSVTPFLVIAVLFYYTAIVQTDVNRLTNADVVVDVNASKWNWTFEYPATVGANGAPVATVGDSEYIPVLVVPINKRIEFVEHSADVIHSFWVPELLFKRDVFPGSVTNRFQTEIETTGAWVGRCAELCGTYHSMMNFEVRAVSEDAFARFLAAKKAGASTPDAIAAMGYPADTPLGNPLATTTHPFDTKRDAG